MTVSLAARNLGKAYPFYARPIESLKEWLRRRPQSEPFWALKDVNFSLKSGASLGIVGDNGAGKSTLLKLLAGTISPSTGSVERAGCVSALLELGSGFDPELSGRENIQLGCATLGLSPAETARQLNEIIAFSELDDFIERPLKTYSTGMSARLGFSLATCTDPEILIIDEVLSVGDEHFRNKALDRMMCLRDQGKSLVFCSHSLSEVEAVCDQTIWLNNGRIEMSGETSHVVESYRMRESSIAGRATEAASPRDIRFGGDTFLSEVRLGGECCKGTIRTGDRLEIFVTAQLTREAWKDGAALSIEIRRTDNVVCHSVNNDVDGVDMRPLGNGKYGIVLVIDELPLLSGVYDLMICLVHKNLVHCYDYWTSVAPFTVTQQDDRDKGIYRIKHRWE
jgi:lipopolysaccharide transport system ATP-binding protein